jgi:hypothetical protein
MEHESRPDVGQPINLANRPARIINAFNDEPIHSLLRLGKSWSDEYSEQMTNVRNNCSAYDICDHGLEHARHTALYIDFLVQATIRSVHEGNMKLDQKSDWDNAMPLSPLVYVALKSDSHYGDRDITVQDHTVYNHAELSGQDIEELANSEQNSEGAQIVRAHKDWYKRAITHSLPSALRSSELLLESTERVKPDQLSAIIPKVADTLDLFRASRLRNVDHNAILAEEERTGQFNAYYRLASSVSSLTLADQGAYLTCDVELEGPMSEYFFPNKNNAFEGWYNMSLSDAPDRNYADNWKLLGNYAALLGKELLVQEASFDTQQALRSAKDYMRAS